MSLNYQREKIKLTISEFINLLPSEAQIQGGKPAINPTTVQDLVDAFSKQQTKQDVLTKICGVQDNPVTVYTPESAPSNNKKFFRIVNGHHRQAAAQRLLGSGCINASDIIEVDHLSDPTKNGRLSKTQVYESSYLNNHASNIKNKKLQIIRGQTELSKKVYLPSYEALKKANELNGNVLPANKVEEFSMLVGELLNYDKRLENNLRSGRSLDITGKDIYDCRSNKNRKKHNHLSATPNVDLRTIKPLLQNKYEKILSVYMFCKTDTWQTAYNNSRISSPFLYMVASAVFNNTKIDFDKLSKFFKDYKNRKELWHTLINFNSHSKMSSDTFLDLKFCR